MSEMSEFSYIGMLYTKTRTSRTSRTSRTYRQKMQKMAKMTHFHCFCLRYPPLNGPLMTIELWKMYKMPFKSDNPSLCMILSQRNYHLWVKNKKIGKNDNFFNMFDLHPPPLEMDIEWL